MTALFKVVNAIACEHLVQGQGNKYTIINTYSGDILVAEFPARIPLSFFIELKPSKIGKFPIHLKISVGRKVAVQGLAEALFEEGKMAIIAMPDGVMLFENPATLKVSIGAEGEKLVTVLRREVRLADQATT